MAVFSLNRTGSFGVVVAALLALLSNSYSWAEEAWDEVIRRQFVEYHVGGRMNDAEIQQHVLALSAQGLWPDIDYSSTRRGEWVVLEHLNRIMPIASAYASPASMHFKAPETRAAILLALRHWLETDYRNSNWWYARIGIPDRLLNVFILMGDEVPEEMLRGARPIIERSSMGMTGQNKVWCAGIALMRGLVYDEPELVEAASAAIWSELKVTAKEGIQLDWSFHQHGPQLQFGNYGLWFGESVVLWASALRDTPYALSGSELEILRGYLLNGPSWVVWDGLFDLGACARQLDVGCQAEKGAHLRSQLENMIAVDPEFADEYNMRLAAPNRLVGFQAYPRSDFAVQRQSDWYASLKMSSSRLIGSENTNSENSLGLHLSDGMLLFALNGKEYADIQPLWDWRRLPGTTCDQGVTDLKPIKGAAGMSVSNFAGVLGGQNGGVAAMIYKRAGLEARKAWFFQKDAVICLGAGITGESEGSVVTSIQQAWAQGPVVSSLGTIPGEERPLNAGEWIHHAGMGYQLMSPGLVSSKEVAGNWQPIYPTRGDRPATGNVFSLWIDHGKSPESAGYAYAVYPQVEASRMKSVVASRGFVILSNTSKLQALESAAGVMAVFYEAGAFRDRSGTSIEASSPCLVSRRGDDFFVVDPTQALEALTLSVGGEEHFVEFPVGEAAGQAVKIR